MDGVRRYWFLNVFLTILPLPRRQNLLFLGAVILPSVLVIALGIRMIRQEDELAEKRFREQNQHAIDLVRQELLTRLEGIKLRAASGNVVPRDPETDSFANSAKRRARRSCCARVRT